MDPPQGRVSKPSPLSNSALPENTGSLIFGSIHADKNTNASSQQNKSKDLAIQSDKNDAIPEGKDKPEEQTKVTSKTCKPIVEERPKIELPSQKINERIQYMTDNALIGKFIGLWPTEKALYGWIAAKWKPKGHITLQLGLKGFFTVIFLCLEDKFRILD